MAFIVEDGTGVADANAYITPQEFTDYHNDRGNDLSGFPTDAEKEQAIIKATDYVDWRWGRAYRGNEREFEDQGLKWPRKNAFDDDGYDLDGVPEKLKFAVSEYALRTVTQELAPDPVVEDSGAKVTMTREKVGPIEEEKRFQEDGGITTIRPYPKADGYMKDVIRRGVGQSVIRG